MRSRVSHEKAHPPADRPPAGGTALIQAESSAAATLQCRYSKRSASIGLSAAAFRAG